MWRWPFSHRGRRPSGAEPVTTATAATAVVPPVPEKRRPATLIELVFEILDSWRMTVRFILVVGAFALLLNWLDVWAWLSDQDIGKWIESILPGNYKWLAGGVSAAVIGGVESRRRKHREK